MEFQLFENQLGWIPGRCIMSGSDVGGRGLGIGAEQLCKSETTGSSDNSRNHDHF